MKKGKIEKVVITNSDDAVRLLLDYMKGQTNNTYQIKGSRAKTATAQEIADWFNSMNPNSKIDLGWFGRSLMQAAKAGNKISCTTVRDAGRTVNIYHRPVKGSA